MSFRAWACGLLMITGWCCVRSAQAAEAHVLFLNANATLYGNRGFTNIVWGDGYPAVSAQFVTDPNVVFAPVDGGGPKQRMANNKLTPGSNDHDNVAFISVYTNDLRLNAMIADTGTVSLTYTFATPMTLVDLILTDLDQGDRLQVALTGPGGAPLSTTNLVFIGEGDLSMTINAGGRPPAELATPPIWNAVTGVLTAAVPWNENRSYTILRIPEGIAAETIILTFTGISSDNDGPVGSALGSHVYVALWATPRPWRLEHPQRIGDALALRVLTLPGFQYRVRSGSAPGVWEQASEFAGPLAPTGHVDWVDGLTPGPGATSRIYGVERWLP